MSTTHRPRTDTPYTAPVRPNFVPRLENGDCLSRDEFERRYAAMPDVKAELLEGVVYMSSPVGVKKHGRPHAYILTWVTTYHLSTSHTDVGDNSTVRLSDIDEPQPDVFLMLSGVPHAQAKVDEDDYIEGAPELVIEVSSSTVSRDLNKKKAIYQKRGILEYIVWRVEDSAIDWFVLRNGNYEMLSAVDEALKSNVFPGLWLDAAALLSGDMQKVISTLQAGIASPEHAAFVRALQSRPGKL
jgi:Uma2 family endonuclease